MKTITTCLLLLFTTLSFAQTDKEKAAQLCQAAIVKMDSGYTAPAIELLEEAMALDPDNYTYLYEIGYAHCIAKNFKQAIKKFKKVTKYPNISDRVYQMLGNSYDWSGKPSKAIKTYETGLKKFPNSGRLHLERGNMEMMNKRYGKALRYYENGIKVDPTFSSNYYWAAKIYGGSTEEVWAMIYGELFMNLERNTIRTQEISQMLFELYKSQITISPDSSIEISFSKNTTLQLNDLMDEDNFKLPFGIGVYEPLLGASVINEKEINIASLNRIRQKFITAYFNSNHHEQYPNVLFEHQKEMLDLNHFESYNYWLLMMGDEEEFGMWHELNKERWDEFVTWFVQHPMELNDSNKFYSYQY
ncbi:tetratricopeptide repeat protein [Limibacter armeniacum]|uniref:tetratricopeptide repeat protein n=1 Tax=Limibacter armeniacum TaxID=466084 RepID=UPI002FE61466